MNNLLILVAVWTGGTASSAWAREDVREDAALCQLALIQAEPHEITLAPGVTLDLVESPARFEENWVALLEHAVPLLYARQPHMFETLFVQNKRRGDLLHIQFRVVSPMRVEITKVAPITHYAQDTYYAVYAYFNDLEEIEFRYPAGTRPLTIDGETFPTVSIAASVRAKLWIKHRLRLNDVRGILAKLTHARRQARGVSTALIYFKRVAYQIYFYQLHDVLHLRTIYELERSKPRRDQDPPDASSNAA